ncbi:MAG: potassium-transporting ATPase subunit KdpC [Nitrospiraceae bacterium]|nr:potassium-transporting ATPase subunit KdpC [Nitrospiraceae bacterium]
MIKTIRISCIALLVFTLFTGFVYPALVTGIAQLIFPYQANGSIIVKDGRAAGSALIGQQFDDPKYFWGRPSATTPYPYNGGSSSGSNLGPNNPELTKAVRCRIDALRAADPGNASPIPVDLVTASGSGLDPHISPAAAEYQVRRVAGVRGMGEAEVGSLVKSMTEGRWLGLLGEPVVNVLRINIALDKLSRKGT